MESKFVLFLLDVLVFDFTEFSSYLKYRESEITLLMIYKLKKLQTKTVEFARLKLSDTYLMFV